MSAKYRITQNEESRYIGLYCPNCGGHVGSFHSKYDQDLIQTYVFDSFDDIEKLNEKDVTERNNSLRECPGKGIFNNEQKKIGYDYTPGKKVYICGEICKALSLMK